MCARSGLVPSRPDGSACAQVKGAVLVCSCAQVANAELGLARRTPQEVSFERSEEQALERGLSRPASLTCLSLSPRHVSCAV